MQILLFKAKQVLASVGCRNMIASFERIKTRKKEIGIDTKREGKRGK